MSTNASEDHAAIEAAAGALFMSFNSTEVAKGSLDRLPALFATGATVAILASGALQTQSVPEFIRPRRELLLGGGLTDFLEWEIEGETLLGRDVACRRSRYAKKGVRDGKAFTGSGTKVLTLVRTSEGWQILSLLWQDDP